MLRRKRIRATSLAVCFAMAVVNTATVAAQTHTFELYGNSDAPGYDYAYFDPPTLDSCQSQCRIEPQCKAFTFNHARQVCFLKLQARNPLKRYRGATTGLKIGTNRFSIRRDRDSPGHDYWSIVRPTPALCQDRCDKDPNCAAFTFNVAKRVCFLKNKRGIQLSYYPGAITGLKVAGDSQSWPSETVYPSAQNPTTSSANDFTGKHEIKLVKEGGTFKVPVRINGVITLHFTIDSGASEVQIPADVVFTLMRAGTIREEDMLEERTYVQADGSKVQSPTFRIRQLQVGDRVLNGVTGSMSNIEGSLLLGQSFLNRFKSWSIDNQNEVLILQ
jgi:predicted aspartyl protease